MEILADSVQGTATAAAPFAGPYAPLVMGIGTVLASTLTWFARGSRAERERKEEHDKTWDEAKKEYQKTK